MNKQLVIVYREDDIKTIEYLSRVSTNQIKGIRVSKDKEITPGQLRNISVENSDGEYFCQWDDDDWYHKDRLQQQIKTILEDNVAACFLRHIVFLNNASQSAYLSFPRLWENTIMCNKKVFLHGTKYQHINKQEDTFFVQGLITKHAVGECLLSPGYVYIQHGNNTWNESHFNMLYALSSKLPDGLRDILFEIVNSNCNENTLEDLLNRDFLAYVNSLA